MLSPIKTPQVYVPVDHHGALGPPRPLPTSIACAEGGCSHVRSGVSIAGILHEGHGVERYGANLLQQEYEQDINPRMTHVDELGDDVRDPVVDVWKAGGGGRGEGGWEGRAQRYLIRREKGT